MENFASTLFVAFRESLEAIAVFVIILTILKQKKAGLKAYLFAYAGAFLGTLVAIGEGLILNYLGSSFNENRIFNIIVQSIILIMVIYFIWWMIVEAKTISSEIRAKYKKTTSLLVTTIVISFITFWREGTEVVTMTFNSFNIWGILVGVALGISVGCLIYFAATKVSIGKVLYILIFFLVLSTAPVAMKWVDLLAQGLNIYKINTDVNIGAKIFYPILRGFFGIKSHATAAGLGTQISWNVIWISLIIIKNRKGIYGQKRNV